ncbi:unconventional prefoldin RPB5 interactor 1 [Gossypium australe]|uniref:Unconventional prefoldin RPB5 interactor 1 n=1 Tax=Gossypium australe TaxID=47621 RepID=A0A5B6V869_9ROSI|nr:unconventional prefoldin RPB5 interactor 1 [Gossypium australe]
MGSSSKDLLRFEHNKSSSSPLESALLVCKKKDSESQTHEPDPSKKPPFTPFPKSQAYDIEVLNGNDSEVIEMDLMLGVADLHTPQALAAAESAIAGNQPPIMVAGNSSSSETESDDSSDEESDDDGNDDKETSCPTEHEKSNTVKEVAVREATGKSRSKKRTRIVELS